MAEFRINDHLYRNRKLHARQQFHVMRRIAPVVGPMSLLMMTQPTTDDPEEMARQMAMTTPMLEALARMPDDEVNYVIDVCMGATQRQSGGNGSGVVWSDVWNAAAHREMFEDIDMGEMLQICWNVIQDSLRNFSPIRQQPPIAQDTPAPIPA